MSITAAQFAILGVAAFALTSLPPLAINLKFSALPVSDASLPPLTVKLRFLQTKDSFKSEPPLALKVNISDVNVFCVKTSLISVEATHSACL